MFVQDPSKYVAILEKFVSSKSRSRQTFLKETVDTTYDEVFVSVEEFLAVFLRMKRELGRIMDRISKGSNDLDEQIDGFIALVEEVEEQINPGQVGRMHTYGKALDGLDSHLFKNTFVRVLDSEEEALAKEYFGAVAIFFETDRKYAHEMRGALRYAQTTANRLRRRDQAPMKINQELSELSDFVLSHESRMLLKWANIARHHAALARRLRN